MPNVMSEMIRLHGAGPQKGILREKVEGLLESAGIRVNGNRPWDIRVLNDRWYRRVLSGGSMALGESFMEGWWDCAALDRFFQKIFSAGLDRYASTGARAFFLNLASKLFNRQSRRRAFEVGKKHYDAGNDLFRAMLDKRMTYTCAHWSGAKNLDEAQEKKLEDSCRALRLKGGERVLDIGCGWGSFMKYAAGKYKARCVGITVSREQMELGRRLCQGLPVEFRLEDYRNLTGEFDRIVSMGMFEHVGYRNYRTFMRKARACLKEGGLFLLSTIGTNRTSRHGDPWFDRYIFPNGMLPSARQVADAIEGLFVVEEWKNFGADYDKTLMAWFSNFNAAWKALSRRHDRMFYRMWEYYLLSLAGAFRARKNQLWQILLSPDIAASQET